MIIETEKKIAAISTMYIIQLINFIANATKYRKIPCVCIYLLCFYFWLTVPGGTTPYIEQQMSSEWKQKYEKYEKKKEKKNHM